jgi:DNA replication and repair protein RecF
VRVTDLRVDGLRNLRSVRCLPGPGFNLVLGGNGAGKTSLVEALHVLSHGRSFRTGQIDTVVGRDLDAFELYVELDRAPAQSSLGMRRDGAGWTLRQDGQTVPTLVEFVRAVAVVTTEPESHLVVTGPAEGRRRFLDWLLFHVEPEFLGSWRRYLRALRQRNAALRVSESDAAVAAWEGELAVHGEQIDRQRRASLAQLVPDIQAMLTLLLPDLGACQARYRQGWPKDMSLAEALADGRSSDRERGFSQRGPHRSDWRLEFSCGVAQGQLSRGQAKLAAMACLLGQASDYRRRQGRWPILVCDDLAAELDSERQGRLLDWLAATGGQVFITATEPGPGWAERVPADTRRFHVEQGRLRPLL